MGRSAGEDVDAVVERVPDQRARIGLAERPRGCPRSGSPYRCSTLIWSPLARRRQARAWDEANATERAASNGGYADLSYTSVDSNRAIVDAVGAVAARVPQMMTADRA